MLMKMSAFAAMARRVRSPRPMLSSPSRTSTVRAPAASSSAFSASTVQRLMSFSGMPVGPRAPTLPGPPWPASSATSRPSSGEAASLSMSGGRRTRMRTELVVTSVR